MDIEHTWSPNIKADTKPVDKVIYIPHLTKRVPTKIVSINRIFQYSIPAKSSVKTTIVLNEVPVFVSKKD